MRFWCGPTRSLFRYAARATSRSRCETWRHPTSRNGAKPQLRREVMLANLTEAELDMVSGGDGATVIQIHNNIHVQAIHSKDVLQALAFNNGVALGHSKVE